MRSPINIGTILYRMDYHLSKKRYTVTKYDDKRATGEINDGDVTYIFNAWSIENGILNFTPAEAKEAFIREKQEEAYEK